MAQINVAILGAGRIAQSMAETLVKMAADDRYRDLVAPYAVAARDGERAAAFAAKYGFPVSYGSYEELVADPNVNLVYIATPHNFHAEQAILCMRAGKGVLVEKAFGANTQQAREILDVSDETGMLCTEAIWTRYMPSRGMIDDIIASGVIGEVQAIDANLCYPTTAKARITDPALAGGALLDVGVYPINFIDMIMHNAPRKARFYAIRIVWARCGARRGISRVRTSTMSRRLTCSTARMPSPRIMTFPNS